MRCKDKGDTLDYFKILSKFDVAYKNRFLL